MPDVELIAAVAALALVDAAGGLPGVAAVETGATPLQLTVTAAGYRASFDRYACQRDRGCAIPRASGSRWQSDPRKGNSPWWRSRASRRPGPHG